MFQLEEGIFVLFYHVFMGARASGTLKELGEALDNFARSQLVVIEAEHLLQDESGEKP